MSAPSLALWSCCFTLLLLAPPVPAAAERHPVPREHPRLLGSRDQLRAMARQRPAEFERLQAVARGEPIDAYSAIISIALVAAIDKDPALASKAQRAAMNFVNGPIRRGHVPFATDLALCGIAYDLCFEAWTEADRERFHAYLNQTVDANVDSETHVFHNGWYGYKNWGIGLACYATYHENARSPSILKSLEEEFRTRTAPALELAGEGGGWAEGYYVHYWLYEWLFFCEVARHCEGVDYYAMAPKFFGNRAVASMFETYPGLDEYGSRRCIPMGDGGGRTFGGDRDKVLSARRILVNYYREDHSHQAVHAFNEITPRSSVGAYAYKDFLWHDTTVAKGNLQEFRLSHLSAGPGYVYTRSSWDDDATYFFFKCGDRFAAHQHLDVGHFGIYKGAELAGDGGHYDEFGTAHDVNYHLRSIAHSTLLVLDPEERWPAIRAGQVTGNDGGQHHAWPHHNGAVSDALAWQQGKALYDIGDLLAFADRGDHVFIAGDGTRAYSSTKVEQVTRQILYLRPNTFVIFDRVKSRNPDFKKTWLLQAMRKPERSGKTLVVTNGKGRLFVQAVLPEQAEIRLVAGEDLYQYGGHTYPPRRNTGPAPECRVEISPSTAQAEDIFLHVLTAADASAVAVPVAQAGVEGGQVKLELNGAQISFDRDGIGGQIRLNGRSQPLISASALQPQSPNPGSPVILTQPRNQTSLLP